jgi:SAM-dependent methyltransferase
MASRALVALGTALRDVGYQFVTPTPGTHARVVARTARSAESLRDVFGWSRPFAKGAIAPHLLDLLVSAGALVAVDDLFRSTVRFSTLGGAIFVHSSYPTTAPDSVFFGPDTYRFCAAIARVARASSLMVDIGCGSGAGGILVARAASRVVLADINPTALSYARVNATLAGATNVETLQSDVLAAVDGRPDFIVANPPYLRDDLHRVYRDGGGAVGEQLSVRIVRESLARLAPGGTLLLYTGAAMVDGRDTFLDIASPSLRDADVPFTYEEVDPDVFGEELERPAYSHVERIAAVVLTATMR